METIEVIVLSKPVGKEAHTMGDKVDSHIQFGSVN